jgi:hypothetical protein
LAIPAVSGLLLEVLGDFPFWAHPERKNTAAAAVKEICKNLGRKNI